MATPTVCDWAAQDWTLRNEAIAAQVGSSVWTVMAWRTRLGHPPAARATRRDKGMPRPHSAALGRRAQPLATEAAKRSPLAGRGPGNVHAVDWALIAPDGKIYNVRNLYDFVRTHAHLFLPADVAWKVSSGRTAEWCNATAGILNIKGGRAKSWKGWTLR